jgi:hypothetical protein
MRKKMRLALPLWGAALVLAALAVGERGSATDAAGGAASVGMAKNFNDVANISSFGQRSGQQEAYLKIIIFIKWYGGLLRRSAPLPTPS